MASGITQYYRGSKTFKLFPTAALDHQILQELRVRSVMTHSGAGARRNAGTTVNLRGDTLTDDLPPPLIGLLSSMATRGRACTRFFSDRSSSSRCRSCPRPIASPAGWRSVAPPARGFSEAGVAVLLHQLSTTRSGFASPPVKPCCRRRGRPSCKRSRGGSADRLLITISLNFARPGKPLSEGLSSSHRV